MKDKRTKPASSMQAAIAFAEAKRVHEEATKLKKLAEQEFVESCAKEGVEFAIIADATGRSSKVFIRRTIRTKVILDKLRGLVKPALLKRLVVEELDQSKVKSALEMGIIQQSVVDEASEATSVVSVMVVELETSVSS